MKIIDYAETKWELEKCIQYEPWGGARYNYNLIVKSNKINEFLEEINELYPDGLTKTQLNDILWFEDGLCYQFVNDEFLDEDEKEQKRGWLD